VLRSSNFQFSNYFDRVNLSNIQQEGGALIANGGPNGAGQDNCSIKEEASDEETVRNGMSIDAGTLSSVGARVPGQRT